MDIIILDVLSFEQLEGIFNSYLTSLLYEDVDAGHVASQLMDIAEELSARGHVGYNKVKFLTTKNMEKS